MNKIKKTDRFIRLLAVFLLITTLSFGSYTVGATELDDKYNQKEDINDKIDNIGDQISDKENEKDDLQAEIDRLEQSAAIKESQKNQALEELESLRLDLLTIDENIAELQAEFEEKEALFLARAKIMYQYSDYSVLDIFFQSDNLFDFFERIDLYKKMLAEDRVLMDEVNSLQTTLEGKKKLRETTFAEKETLLAETEKAIEAIKNDQELAESEFENLISAIDELTHEEDKLTQDANELQADIDYLEYLKQQEEEAKKKEEEEKLSNDSVNTENSGSSSETDSSTGTGPVSDAGFIFPLESYVYLSSPYGYRTHPVTGKPYSFHTGIDLAAYGGTPIYAAADGVVSVAEPVDRGGYGKWVEITHSNGIKTRYAHADAIYVSVGTTVKQGQKIAIVGTTGTSTGNHLHFEVMVGGERVNPRPYITLP